MRERLLVAAALILFWAGSLYALAQAEEPTYTYRYGQIAADGDWARPTAATEPIEAELQWPSDRQLTREEMLALVQYVGFPSWTWERALAVAWCESKWRPWATGAQGEVGIFQLHPRYHADATYDVVGNARATFRISRGGTDWSQWSCQ